MRALLALPCLAFACATTPEPIAAHNPPGAPTRLEAVPRPAPIFDGKQFALGRKLLGQAVEDQVQIEFAGDGDVETGHGDWGLRT